MWECHITFAPFFQTSSVKQSLFWNRTKLIGKLLENLSTIDMVGKTKRLYRRTPRNRVWVIVEGRGREVESRGGEVEGRKSRNRSR